MSREDLTKLIADAIRGDEKAFEELYRLHVKRILFYCGTMLNNPDEAENAAQEVALALWRNIKRLRSPYAFKAYLSRIIYMVCAARNKKERGYTENIEDYDNALVDPSADSACHVEEKDFSERIRELIDHLPKKQRMVVYFYYYDDLSYEEIARALGISTNTVGSNLTKARKALEKLMTENQITESKETKALIAAAIGQGIESVVTDERAAAVIRGSDALLAKAREGNRFTHKWLAAGIAAVVMICIAAFLPSSPLGKIGLISRIVETPSAVDASQGHPEDSALDLWAPIGKIEMVSADSGRAGQYNPISAVLSIADGVFFAWDIIDANGVVTSGFGADATSGLSGLPDGDYKLQYVAENASGQRVEITREFFID